MHPTEFCFKQPLLEEISELMAELCGIRFMVVFPKEQGWGQISPSNGEHRHDFCRIVQSTRDGGRYCRMCHVLMTVAACAGGECEQRCHAGAFVLIQPVVVGADRELALVSDCTFARLGGPDGWKSVKVRGKKLRIDLTKMKSAYYSLPEMSKEKITMARKFMNVAGEAVKELYAKFFLEIRAMEVKAQTNSGGVHLAVEQALKNYLSSGGGGGRAGAETKRRRGRKVPLVIEVIADIVTRHPNMSFNVSEIAAAAKMTPNHFSTLFHNHMKKCFSDFLTENRMRIAKELLCDLTLNIAEVSSRAGYDDSGYFARKFKQISGVTPREWRAKEARKYKRDR